jgi:hypothetical protein
MYVDEITGDRQCGIKHNTSTTVHIFCTCQIWMNKWKYNGRVHQLFPRLHASVSSSYETSIVHSH